MRRLLPLFLLSILAAAQTLQTRPKEAVPPVAPGLKPNSEPSYVALRTGALAGPAISVSNLQLKRDAGVFNFESGSFHFTAPVNGKMTTAVFLGKGTFTLDPPLISEKRSLAVLTKEPRMVEEFERAVFFFTDDTYNEIKSHGSSSTAADDAASSTLSDVRNALRTKLRENVYGRLLEDVLSDAKGGFFEAHIKGKKYSGKMLYEIDPHGLRNLGLQPEEAALMTWDDLKYGVWAAFHFSDEYKNGTANGTEQNGSVKADHYRLDVQLEKSGKINGKATSTVISQADGTRVVPLDLFQPLRVESVTSLLGEPLNFIQENKDADAEFFVVLPKALAKGESATFTTVYAGKDAVSNEGGGNYYPVARDNWYPNVGFGDYATYNILLHVPKGLKMVATGDLKKEYNEGNETISEWETPSPITVAGFNVGKFKSMNVKLKSGFTVDSYANENPPDFVQAFQEAASESHSMAVGTMNTSSLNQKAMAEAQLATALYSDYFGPLSINHLSITQQTADNYGQAWPGLVYLPITYFFDTTVRHQIGMGEAHGYFRVVEPHEVAHQWWGHLVGWKSYRDQWMSEGFAEFSASLYVQEIYKNAEFLKFWKEERELLTQKNREGFRPIDVGSVTQGERLINSKQGNIYRFMVYPKGAFIVHMIRMMMWDRQQHDAKFRAMMQDFVKTYSNKAASTEDFKAMVEKHMTPQMDIDGSHRMDWYFNEYVYGTSLPDYKVDYSFAPGAQGQTLKLKVTQSNVDKDFVMLVPVYLEFGNGGVTRLGSITLVGNTTFSQEIPLGNVKDQPKKVSVNYYYDVLSTGGN